MLVLLGQVAHGGGGQGPEGRREGGAPAGWLAGVLVLACGAEGGKAPASFLRSRGRLGEGGGAGGGWGAPVQVVGEGARRAPISGGLPCSWPLAAGQ